MPSASTTTVMLTAAKLLQNSKFVCGAHIVGYEYSALVSQSQTLYSSTT